MDEKAIDSPMATEKPTCLALLVATIIWTDPKSKTRTIVQPIGAIGSPKFPATLEGLPIYFSIAGELGRYQLRMEMTGPGDNKRQLFEMACETNIDMIGVPADFSFHLPKITFDEPGMYLIRFLWNNELLMERRFPVHLGNPEEQP